jgi:hypothetical protein
MLALCAYLAGELEHAYALLDHVEVDRPDDVALHYLLWRCASAIGHSQTASIRSFAEKAARDVQAMPSAHSELQRSYAAALVPGTGRRVHAQQAMPLAAAGAPAAHSEWPPTAGGQARPAATEDAPESAAPLVATALDLATLEPVQGSALAQLEHIVAFRALHEAADGSPLAAAVSSTLALTALVTSVTSK